MAHCPNLTLTRALTISQFLLPGSRLGSAGTLCLKVSKDTAAVVSAEALSGQGALLSSFTSHWQDSVWIDGLSSFQSVNCSSLLLSVGAREREREHGREQDKVTDRISTWFCNHPKQFMAYMQSSMPGSYLKPVPISPYSAG